MLFPLILICIILACTVNARNSPIFSNSLADTCPDPDPLACFLYSQSIELPEIDLDVDGTSLKITNFLCSQFLIKDILSKFLYQTSFMIGADGVGTTCSGHYSYGRMKGDMTAVISKTDISMTINVPKKNEYPSAVLLPACDIPSMDIALTFSSSGLDQLAPAIAKLLEALFQTILCTEVKTILEVNVTNAIVHKIDPLLERIVTSQPSPLPTQYGNHFLNWNNSFVSKIHNLLSLTNIPKLANVAELLQCLTKDPSATNQMMFPMSSQALTSQLFSTERKELTSASVTVNSYADAAFAAPAAANIEGSITQSNKNPSWEELIDKIQKFMHDYTIDFTSLDLAKRTLLTTPAMKIALTNIHIVDLVGIHGIKLLEPIPQSKVALRTSLSAQKVHIQVGLQVISSAGTVNYYLDLQLEQIQFLLDLVIAVDKHLLDSYYMDQILLQDHNCLWASISEMSIPNFLVTSKIDFLQLVYVSSDIPSRHLEQDIVNLLDEFSKLLLAPLGYNTLVNEVLAGIFQGPLRNAINALLAVKIEKQHRLSPCLSHYPYDDVTTLVDWSESPVFMKLVGLVNQYWGVNKVNQLMNCITDNTGELTIDISKLMAKKNADTNTKTSMMRSMKPIDFSKATIRDRVPKDSKLVSSALPAAVPLFDSSPLTTTTATTTAAADSAEESSTGYELKISGLNSFYAFELFVPVIDTSANSLYQLGNAFGIGYCESTTTPGACNPLKVTLQKKSSTVTTTNAAAAIIAPSTPAQKMVRTLRSIITNNLEAKLHTTNSDTDTPVPSASLVLAFQNIDYFTNFVMKLDMASIYQLQKKDYSDPGCAMSTIDQLNFVARSLNIQDTKLTISTPNIVDRTTTAVDISTPINTILNRMMTTEKVMDVENNQWDTRLTTATATCPATMSSVTPDPEPTPTPDSNTDDSASDNALYYWVWAVAGAGIGAIIISGIYFGLYRYYQTTAEQDEDLKAALSNDKNYLLTSSYLGPIYNPFHAVTMWSYSTNGNPTDYALLYHPKLSLAFRILVPLAILGNVALFLNSNILPDSVSVLVDVHIGEKTISLGSIFDFGLQNTVVDMWDAGVYPLSILVMFFSGIWPYMKLVGMLVCWCIPIQYLSLPTRETILVVVDAAGKWSLIDFFVMVLMLCAFYCELIITPQLSVDVTVKPKWGFYNFVIATIISLTLGHVIVAYHRYCTEPPSSTLINSVIHAEDSAHTLSNTTYILYWDNQYFEDEHKTTSSSASTTKTNGSTNVLSTPVKNTTTTMPVKTIKRRMLLQYTRLGYWIIQSSLILTMITMAMGAYTMTLGFEFKGLVGLLLKDKAKTDYSIITVGEVIPTNSGVPNDPSILWTQACYFVFTIGAPSVLLLAIAVLWNVPMSFHAQRKVIVFTEVVNAWAALDVFCVGTAAGLLEVQQFAMFIIGDSCDGINNYLTKPVIDMLLDGDDKCFDVVAYLTSNCWLLFVPALGVFILSTITIMSAQHFILQRIHPDYLIHGAKASSFSHIQADEETVTPLLLSPGIHRDDSLYQLQQPPMTGTTSSPLPILPEQLEDDHPSVSSTDGDTTGNTNNHKNNSSNKHPRDHSDSSTSLGHKKSTKSVQKRSSSLTWSEWYSTRCTWQNFLLQCTLGLVHAGCLQIVSEEKLWNANNSNSQRMRATSTSLYYPNESMTGSMSFPVGAAPSTPLFYPHGNMKGNHTSATTATTGTGMSTNAVHTMNSLYAGITPIPISVNMLAQDTENNQTFSSPSHSHSMDGGTYTAPMIEEDIRG